MNITAVTITGIICLTLVILTMVDKKGKDNKKSPDYGKESEEKNE
jgi:hypothetical protein